MTEMPPSVDQVNSLMVPDDTYRSDSCVPTRPTRSSSDVVSSGMPPSEVVSILVQHGCVDLTNRIDFGQCGHTPISGGGSGDVYRGKFIQGEEVAIKCIRPYLPPGEENGQKFLKRTARELYLWSLLKHRNVMELLGLVVFRDRLAMVSPWMNNGTLVTYIEGNPAVDRHKLCVDIASGVAYLHENKMTHGDIKGANVLVSDDGVAKLADFGCSKLEKTSALRFTTTETALGFSTRWSAPEILNESKEPDQTTDVYALGMTLLEAITGMIPFPDIGNNLAVYNAVVLQGKFPPRPEQFPSFGDNEANALWAIMLKSWARRPAHRPSSFAVLNVLQGLGTSSASDRAPHQFTDPLPLSQSLDRRYLSRQSPMQSPDSMHRPIPQNSSDLLLGNSGSTESYDAATPLLPVKASQRVYSGNKWYKITLQLLIVSIVATIVFYTMASISAADCTYSQKDAQELIESYGIIAVSSGGNCTNKSNPRCTSYEGIQCHTVRRLEELSSITRCEIIITGATETGHVPGEYSHGNGYALNLRKTSCLNSYIRSHYKAAGTCLLTDIGNKYCDKTSYWDVTYYK
ncbi:Serine/threonine-protein kinase [Ceratobasidium sp. AG-Ba]|nr:Serine/threonine-protein kinase [Ceratobasidium sp. AG-Ba]